MCAVRDDDQNLLTIDRPFHPDRATEPAIAGPQGVRHIFADTLRRPYPVVWPMIAFISLIPMYPFIANLAQRGPVHVPAIALDARISLRPAWSLVYGALYIFLIMLPVFLLRQPRHIRRTVYAYLVVWATAYLFFIAYPTAAPRPVRVDGTGFGTWGLRILYDADPPFNCFPSIHVAHSFVSALTCLRVHRGVAAVSLAAAALVAISTLFTKQHWVADVVAGALLSLVAYGVCLRGLAEPVPALDRRVAPTVAAGTLALALIGLAGFWTAYLVIG